MSTDADDRTARTDTRSTVQQVEAIYLDVALAVVDLRCRMRVESRNELAGWMVYGDRYVTMVTHERLWATVVRRGKMTGDWVTALVMMMRAADEIIGQRQQAGGIGSAIHELRVQAARAVLEQAERIRADVATSDLAAVFRQVEKDD